MNKNLRDKNEKKIYQRKTNYKLDSYWPLGGSQISMKTALN